MKWMLFFKKHMVLLLAALAAVLSMFWNPPSRAMWGYLDWNVLAMLFCLMAVVAGFRKIGVFQSLADVCCKHLKSTRMLAFLLWNLCFFLSMFVTNDVALITFVPFTCSLLQREDQRTILLRIVAIEAAAANLGSMATPIGNPQNLYLYSTYSFSMGTFFKTILPIVGISYIGLLCSLLLIPQQPLSMKLHPDTTESSFSFSARKKELLVYSVLGVFCLATVAGFVTHAVCFCAVLLGIIAMDRRLIRRVDWELLLTFVCFFLFSGNLQQIESVRALMMRGLSGGVCLTAALVSQVISNVPAAVLLSGFTEQGKELLLGVDIGGLGTPIASLASLIAYQYYAKSKLANTAKYLWFFSVYQFIGLFLLLGIQLILP